MRNVCRDRICRMEYARPLIGPRYRGQLLVEDIGGRQSYPQGLLFLIYQNLLVLLYMLLVFRRLVCKVLLFPELAEPMGSQLNEIGIKCSCL